MSRPRSLGTPDKRDRTRHRIERPTIDLDGGSLDEEEGPGILSEVFRRNSDGRRPGRSVRTITHPADARIVQAEQALKSHHLEEAYRLVMNAVVLFRDTWKEVDALHAVTHVLRQLEKEYAALDIHDALLIKVLWACENFIQQWDFERNPKVLRELLQTAWPAAKPITEGHAHVDALAEAKDPAEEGETPYAQSLRHLLHAPFVSDASRYRRKKLMVVSPAIEAYIRKRLHNEVIQIAVIPWGSSLKGYASDDTQLVEASDVDYGIYILTGLGSEVKQLDERVKLQIIQEANRYINEGESFYADPGVACHVEIYNIQALVDGHASFREHPYLYQFIFLPVVYGNRILLQQARAHLVTAIDEKQWQLLRENYYGKNLHITPAELKDKRKVRQWMSSNASYFGIDFRPFEESLKTRNSDRSYEQANRVADAFNAYRWESAGLPDLQQMRASFNGTQPSRTWGIHQPPNGLGFSTDRSADEPTQRLSPRRGLISRPRGLGSPGQRDRIRHREEGPGILSEVFRRNSDGRRPGRSARPANTQKPHTAKQSGLRAALDPGPEIIRMIRENKLPPFNRKKGRDLEIIGILPDPCGKGEITIYKVLDPAFDGKSTWWFASTYTRFSGRFGIGAYEWEKTQYLWISNSDGLNERMKQALGNVVFKFRPYYKSGIVPLWNYIYDVANGIINLSEFDLDHDYSKEDLKQGERETKVEMVSHDLVVHAFSIVTLNHFPVAALRLKEYTQWVVHLPEKISPYKPLLHVATGDLIRTIIQRLEFLDGMHRLPFLENLQSELQEIAFPSEFQSLYRIGPKHRSYLFSLKSEDQSIAVSISENDDRSEQPRSPGYFRFDSVLPGLSESALATEGARFFRKIEEEQFPPKQKNGFSLIPMLFTAGFLSLTGLAGLFYRNPAAFHQRSIAVLHAA